MNIYDIAEKAGVSIATVSRVLNGSDKVSEKTRLRVLNIIEAEGYSPNLFAQGLGNGVTHSIGIIVPDIADTYMSTSVSCLEKELSANGYTCLLVCSGYAQEGKEKAVQMLMEKKVDALILVGSTYASSGEDAKETAYLREAALSLPVFLINGSVSSENIYCAVCGDREAIRHITTDLLARGRRRILFLTNSGSYSALEKHAGYEQALADAGLQPEEGLFLRVHNKIDDIRDYLLSHPELTFDAAIAVEDGIAAGVVKYALAAGLRIPEDLEIVGYNNSVLSVCSSPEITSIDSRVEGLCRLTVENLAGVLKEKKEVPALSLLACHLIPRGTTLHEA